jgi:hypothetical protein
MSRGTRPRDKDDVGNSTKLILRLKQSNPNLFPLRGDVEWFHTILCSASRFGTPCDCPCSIKIQGITHS